MLFNLYFVFYYILRNCDNSEYLKYIKIFFLLLTSAYQNNLKIQFFS
jgi:hypothetical protein